MLLESLLTEILEHVQTKSVVGLEINWFCALTGYRRRSESVYRRSSPIVDSVTVYFISHKVNLNYYLKTETEPIQKQKLNTARTNSDNKHVISVWGSFYWSTGTWLVGFGSNRLMILRVWLIDKAAIWKCSASTLFWHFDLLIPEPLEPWRKQLLRIFGPELIRINSTMKTVRSAVSKTRFFLRRQPQKFENVTLVARRREHVRVFLAIFLVAQPPPKRSVLVHKNSLPSYQRCRHSVEPRALTCPFKLSHGNLSAWSCLTYDL